MNATRNIVDVLKAKFMEMIHTMDMAYSYKPVLLKAMLEQCDVSGKVRLDAVVDYFIAYYGNRKENSLIIEKKEQSVLPG